MCWTKAIQLHIRDQYCHLGLMAPHLSTGISNSWRLNNHHLGSDQWTAAGIAFSPFVPLVKLLAQLLSEFFFVFAFLLFSAFLLFEAPSDLRLGITTGNLGTQLEMVEYKSWGQLVDQSIPTPRFESHH